MDKKTLRREILKKRDALSAEDRYNLSKKIHKNLFERPEFVSAKQVLCYVDFRSEVSTEKIIEESLKRGKRVFCPKVLSGEWMEFYEVAGKNDLESGAYGILEPLADENRKYAFLENDDLMILPGACFDRTGNRIGYGAGYYDRYLQMYPNLKKVGICFACQLTEQIWAESTDQKVDMIITEKEVIQIV